MVVRGGRFASHNNLVVTVWLRSVILAAYPSCDSQPTHQSELEEKKRQLQAIKERRERRSRERAAKVCPPSELSRFHLSLVSRARGREVVW